jgi:hypothetical protein
VANLKVQSRGVERNTGITGTEWRSDRSAGPWHRPRWGVVTKRTVGLQGSPLGFVATNTVPGTSVHPVIPCSRGAESVQVVQRQASLASGVDTGAQTKSLEPSPRAVE